jgi:hypothetical protein
MFQEGIVVAQAIIEKSDPSLPATLATEFIGDVIECGFRSDIDPLFDLKARVKIYSTKYNLPFKDLKRIADLCHVQTKVP